MPGRLKAVPAGTAFAEAPDGEVGLPASSYRRLGELLLRRRVMHPQTAIAPDLQTDNAKAFSGATGEARSRVD
jgi:hypothetical protein